ncbi:MAG: T9SS type A sorting domain-containing protein [Bacteroidales bacterium]|nr:T9SS type A sorting domain-containing protein [Bacteroidales bacterium]
MKRLQLRKLAMALAIVLIGSQAFAQGRIDLNPKAKDARGAQNVSMTGFSATFSFNSIESMPVSTEKGEFSIINLDNSVAAGNIGEPQVPVKRELIAVPFGATPVVTVKNYTVKDYNLADYGIEKLYPMQPSQSKSEKEVKFVYNEEAYAAKGYNEELPLAMVTVMGQMRGVQVGALQLNAVRYDAAANSIRVYNDIEVEVTFENADLALTEKTLVNTYSPYFRTVYATLFNEKAIRDIYDEHPDLWAVPVKVLVIANRMFEDAMQPWIEWKTEKGFYLDVNYTDEIGTSASAIKTFITNKYNEGVAAGQAPTFLIIFGDSNQVPASQTGSATHCVTDLYYYAVAGGSNDYFGDMYHSRFTAETVAEMNVMIGKSLQYEQYTMPDPSYLSNVLLIAGWDSSWNPKAGKPTIQYAMNYYYNTEHGFANVYNFLEQPYNNPYASMNTGVNFVNYTAHGSNTSWSDPSFTNSSVNSLTNQDKYFLAMGNCCQAADWGISGKCLGETFVTAANKGAFAYIGSCPSSYWYEDYYFGVGATNTFYQAPTYEESTMGVYDASFQDDFNSISAIPFVGNVAVAYSHANGYQGSVSDQYYWESYHVLGDGSICLFHTNPIENTVQHMPTLPIGMDFYTVSADPGSYVGISKDGILYGAGEIGEEGTADIQITPITSGGNAKIVVTHPQRQPYIAEVPCAAMTGAYVAVDSYALNVEQANYGETVDMNVTLKNVGTLPSGAITATLTSDCEYVTVLSGEGSCPALDPDQMDIVAGFQFEVAENVPDKLKAQFVLDVTDGTDTWSANINITLHAPVLAFEAIEKTDDAVTITFKNTGTAPFYGGVLSLTSCSPDLVFDPETLVAEDVVEGGQTLALTSNYTIASSVEPGTTFEAAYNFTTGLFEIEDIFVISYGAIMEDFESGVFSSDWSFSQTNSWTIVDGGVKGTKCAKSMNEGLSSTDYSATLTVNVLAAGNLTFQYYVSSEANYDKLFFYMDNQQMGVWSGSVAWSEFVQPVTVGQHTFKWEYHKDSSVNSGDDCAKIDDIKFPPTNVITFLAPATDLVAEVDGGNVALSWAASADADKYVIKRNGETIANAVTATSYNDVLPKDGVYTYAVFAATNAGNMSTPVTTTVVAEFDNVINPESVKVSVYPNPAQNVLNIVTDANNYEYQIINSIGQVVLSGNANGRAAVNVSELNGVYFLRIVADGNVAVRKITVK